MQQPALFHESLTDALREVVRALGGIKVVGAKMRPERAPDEAGRWLADCLNPDRREHLDPDQVLWLIKQGRAVGCHSIVDFICQQGGYCEPDPVEPQDEIAELQRQYIEAAKSMGRMAERIEQLAGMANVRRVA